MTDLLRKYKSLYSSTTNTFSTGESVTITPASVTGLPTDTEITLTFDRVDATGNKTPDKMERIRGTISGSNFVVSSGGRAVEGTEQVHTAPVVEMVWNADDLNDMVDWGLVEHGQDGKHTDALVTTLKATGAVVNTGTSDVTIVTPKAIADSNVVITDKEQTLTLKTLTSPKINEDVVLTSTATELNNLHSKTLNLGAWTAFTPSWGNLTEGSGTNVGLYCQIGKTVHVYAKFTLAADSSVSGLITLTWPVTAKRVGLGPVGRVLIYDAGTDTFMGHINESGECIVEVVNGTYVQRAVTSATVPMTWTTNDYIVIYATYEAN